MIKMQQDLEMFFKKNNWTDLSDQFCEPDKLFQRKDTAQKTDSFHSNEQSY